jgi:hypothetical protein
MFNAKDLSKEPPRSPRVRMGGYSILVRMIDKGRAVLNGTVGEYEYNCGLDQMLFSFKGLDHEEVKRFLASGASDEEVLDWVNSHGTSKTSAEIEEFSNSFEKFRPYDDPDLRELFRKTYASLGLDPKTSTVADYLDADDRVSFRDTPAKAPQSTDNRFCNGIHRVKNSRRVRRVVCFSDNRPVSHC